MTTRERGFTLLEVLVALAILGLAVVAVIQGFAQGLRLLKLSGDHQRATQLADRKVREVMAIAFGGLRVALAAWAQGEDRPPEPEEHHPGPAGFLARP